MINPEDLAIFQSSMIIPSWSFLTVVDMTCAAFDVR
jgi:hypothetical protein